MQKKEYIKPMIQCYKVELEGLICGSLSIDPSDDDPLYGDGYGDPETDALSKEEYDDWGW